VAEEADSSNHNPEAQIPKHALQCRHFSHASAVSSAACSVNSIEYCLPARACQVQLELLSTSNGQHMLVKSAQWWTAAAPMPTADQPLLLTLQLRRLTVSFSTEVQAALISAWTKPTIAGKHNSKSQAAV
jgi:hypothetical protein